MYRLRGGFGLRLMVVVVCAIAGRVNLPGFVSAIHAQDIILVAVPSLAPRQLEMAR